MHTHTHTHTNTHRLEDKQKDVASHIKHVNKLGEDDCFSPQIVQLHFMQFLMIKEISKKVKYKKIAEQEISLSSVKQK